MNIVSAINEWVVPGSDQRAEAQPHAGASREQETDQPLWKICQATSRAHQRESAFYAFFLLLAVLSAFSAFATLLDMLNSGALDYFVDNAVR
jgi:hypothetical protein